MGFSLDFRVFIAIIRLSFRKSPLEETGGGIRERFGIGKMKKSFFVSIIILCGNMALAIPVMVQISGHVTDIRDFEEYPYDEIIHIGDTFTGTYTYDTETSSSSSSTNLGYYVHNSPYGFNISLEGFVFKTAESHSGQFTYSIYNDYPSAQPYDRYIIESYQNDSLSTGISVNRIAWDLFDGTHTAISSILIPFEAPDIDEWGSGGTFVIGCGEGESPLAIWGTVTQTALCPLSVADVDVNGDVNLWDFATFAAAWQSVDGEIEYNPLCDISAPNGVIDANDLSVFFDQWLFNPCQ